MGNDFLRVLIGILLLLPAGVAADTVIMKNGTVYRNVVSVADRNGYQLVFQNGRTIRVRKEAVRRIQIQQVLWKPQKVIEYRDRPVPVEPSTRKNKPVAPPPAPGDPDRLRYLAALLPGLQQERDGEQVAGAIFFFGFFGALGATANANLLYSKALDDSRLPLPVLAGLFFTAEQQNQSGIPGEEDNSTAELALFSVAYMAGLRAELNETRANLENLSLLTGFVYLFNYLHATLWSGRHSPSDAGTAGVRFDLVISPTSPSHPQERPGTDALVRFTFRF